MSAQPRSTTTKSETTSSITSSNIQKSVIAGCNTQLNATPKIVHQKSRKPFKPKEKRPTPFIAPQPENSKVSSHPKGPGGKKKRCKTKFAKTDQRSIALAPPSYAKFPVKTKAQPTNTLSINTAVDTSLNTAAPNPDPFYEAGFQLLPLHDESLLSKFLTHTSPLPSALQPLVNQIQQSGLYRLNIPNQELAAQFAQGEVWLTRNEFGLTTSISKRDGFAGSGNIIRAGSTGAKAVSMAFAALSFVTSQYYLRSIDTKFSIMQEQLLMIVNHLEIQSLARFNLCKTKMLELSEDCYALVDSADTDHPAGDSAKQDFFMQLRLVEQTCKQLSEETKLARQMKRKELDNLVSEKTKIDEKGFKKCEPIIQNCFYAHMLKVFLLTLIVQKDSQLTPSTLALNKNRLKVASEEIQEILDFTEHVKQLAIDEEKSRSVFTRIGEIVMALIQWKDPVTKYEPLKEKFDYLGNQMSSRAKSYLIHFDREQNSAKILPEV